MLAPLALLVVAHTEAWSCSLTANTVLQTTVQNIIEAVDVLNIT